VKNYIKLDQSYSKVVKPDWRDKLEVELGDTKQPDKLHPQVKIKRWDNEVNCSVRLKDFDNFTSKKEDNKLKLIKDKKEVHLYDIEPCEEHPEGGFEFEVILKEKPVSNKLEFSIETKGLDFFYQPALEREEWE